MERPRFILPGGRRIRFRIREERWRGTNLFGLWGDYLTERSIYAGWLCSTKYSCFHLIDQRKVGATVTQINGQLIGSSSCV